MSKDILVKSIIPLTIEYILIPIARTECCASLSPLKSPDMSSTHGRVPLVARVRASHRASPASGGGRNSINYTSVCYRVDNEHVSVNDYFLNKKVHALFIRREISDKARCYELICDDICLFVA